MDIEKQLEVIDLAKRLEDFDYRFKPQIYAAVKDIGAIDFGDGNWDFLEDWRYMRVNMYVEALRDNQKFIPKIVEHLENDYQIVLTHAPCLISVLEEIRGLINDVLSILE